MDKMTDQLISKGLKKWAFQCEPPANGRARLLWEAARQERHERRRILQFRAHQTDQQMLERYRGQDWSRVLSDWINLHFSSPEIRVRVY
jgi:hypothetical protein